MMDFSSPFLILAVIVVLYVISSIKILAEYERGVIFRLGKLLSQPKGPGVILVFSPIDRMVRVSLRTIVLDVPPQDVITRDNVSVKVNAVVYFRVMDPRRAKVIHAEGELQASEKLLQAAQILSQRAEAMQLRYLQTLSNIAGDKASTIVFPVPMDLIAPLLEAIKKRSP